MNMFLYLKRRALLLHLNAEQNVEIHILRCSLLIVSVYIILGVIGILHILSLMLCICFLIDTKFVEVWIHILGQEILTCEVYHRTCVAGLVYNEQAWYTGILSHLGVVGTESGCNMNDTCTILGGNIITGNNTESLSLLDNGLTAFYGTWLYPWHELLILYTNQLRTLTLPEDFKFLAFLGLEVR